MDELIWNGGGRNPQLPPEIYMPDGSSTVMRYVKWDMPAKHLLLDADGSGSLEVLADEKTFLDAGAGTHEIQLCCKGGLTVHSVAFCG